MLHHVLGGATCYRQEIIEVPGLLVGLFITYDDVRDDVQEIFDNLTWEEFVKRLCRVKADWATLERGTIEALGAHPEKTFGGWEGRTIYMIKGGRHPEQWTQEDAIKDLTALLTSSASRLGAMIQYEADNLRNIVPAGNAYFRSFEHYVRVIMNYLFVGPLGEGRAQSRTAPEDEGVEIRDIIFDNKADTGFWKDLKDKYFASEIVVDAKNTENLTRDDLRQLYCYLKPALGFWGFIVCRSEQGPAIHAYNRTLFRNFSQSRGLLILCVDDLRRMVQIRNRSEDSSLYLRDRMSEFVRSI
jgi:hypothetical protein